MRTFLIFISVLTLVSCSRKFPQCDETKRSYLVVVANNSDDNYVQKIENCEEEIQFNDEINVKNLIFLQQGKGVKQTNGRIPFCLKSKEKYKVNLYIYNSEIYNRRRNNLEEIIPLVNIMLDELLMGIEIEINYIETLIGEIGINQLLDRPCILTSQEEKIINIVITEALPSNVKAQAHRCGNSLVILSGGAIFNAVTFAHEIAHIFCEDNSDSEDIMKNSIPVVREIKCRHEHYFLISGVVDIPDDFGTTNTETIFTLNPNHVTHGARNSQNNKIEEIYNMVLTENINENILYTMHPEVINPSSSGFEKNYQLFLGDFENDVLPASLIISMKEMYEFQYAELSKQYNYSKKILGFYSYNRTLNIGMQEYVEMSLENLKYIRDRNFLYWIARKEKLGKNVSRALSAITYRNLSQRYLAIKNRLN